MASAPLDEVFRLVLEIERSDELGQVEQSVRAFAGPLGYDRFILFSASAKREDLIDRIYWVEGDWFGDNEPVSADLYVRRCPVTRHILETREAFFWTKLKTADGDRYRVVSRPSGAGLHGLQIPVFGPSGLEAALSLGGEKIDASAHTRLALTLLATAAAVAAQRLNEDMGAVGRLSSREREVLGWTAAGRRQSEIAAVLDLSARTVENHLRRIRHKLGVATTAQAIKLAIRNGDIDA
ncbi:PA1136 family autoinducer-binding transcriptional regulator [Paracoccus tegillarcae]|uniref:LuxR family transcriptional regulator n=1 Tax=Paracoccus tegillarcae TaxID=1529068 RepID=A0A2K9F1R0_9RHOB|nr:PA1136 family autoinducer-binding transcriptional regulator [Paracoccus tegillarcae]AUH33071.1 LuxR family transcriptional regulator [Paracoccus tegillarcae]